MRKFATLVALGALLAAGPAFAQSTMQNTFGNTVVVTGASGSETRYFFNEDGTFTGVAPGGSQMAGRWRADGDQLCLIAPNGRENCTAVAGDKNVGDTWEQTSSDGSAITVTLQAGR
jgi:hypothetical protein